jgi:hypothetical protein
MIVGQLDPSAFAPDHDGDRRRLAAGLVASLTPTFLPNVEVGGGRFFHRRWPPEGLSLSTLSIPFEGFLKDRLLSKDSLGSVADNQLASAWARLAFPRAGVETYVEVLRDDHSLDLRDLLVEPDHEFAYAFGLRKAWVRSPSGDVTVLTLESVNGRITHLSRVRVEVPIYVHDPIVEGHTLRGKLLGSPAALGGSGIAVVLDRRTQTGGWKAALRSEHVAQNMEGGRWNGTQVGFTQLEVSRTTLRQRLELTYGGAARVNWDDVQGARANLSMLLSARPFWATGRGSSQAHSP